MNVYGDFETTYNPVVAAGAGRTLRAEKHTRDGDV